MTNIQHFNHSYGDQLLIKKKSQRSLSILVMVFLNGWTLEIPHTTFSVPYLYM